MRIDDCESSYIYHAEDSYMQYSYSVCQLGYAKLIKCNNAAT